MTDEDAAAAARADAIWAKDAGSQGLGMVLERVGAGAAALSMRVTEAMVNGLGVCHGGFIFALADSAMAFAANCRGRPEIAQQAAITFLRPAKQGDTLTATAEARAAAGRTTLFDVRVCTADGETIAEFRGHTRALGTKSFGAGEGS